jgi:hypothetical protein
VRLGYIIRGREAGESYDKSRTQKTIVSTLGANNNFAPRYYIFFTTFVSFAVPKR